jgi:thiamine biosynthesis lipoprotein
MRYSEFMTTAALRAWAIGAALVPVVASAQARHEFTAVHMGVPVRVSLYSHSAQEAAEAARAAFARIAELDDRLSDYRPRSEIRLLAERPRAWQSVSSDLLEVLLIARRVTLWSDGAFDVTVGPLVQLWRTSRQTQQLPDESSLSSAMERSGPRLLKVDSTRQSVWLQADSMRLDLGGVAKGYILQEALQVLEARGVRSAMIEAGGDVVLGDAPPGRAGWSIEIAGADGALPHGTTSLANVAVATSGTGEQFVEIGGVPYAHIVDPRTGLGATRRFQVSVIAKNAALADALATALGLMGPEAEPVLRARAPGILNVAWKRELPRALP